MISDLNYLIALNEFPKFGSKSLARLMDYFSSAQSAFETSASNLKQAGIHDNVINEFLEFRKNINPEALMQQVLDNQISILTLTDDSYPSLLKQIYDPPYLLFVKGTLPNLNDHNSLSIVGSRKASDYGMQVAKNLTQEIAKQGIVTVSGLAFGIDEIVHRSTIDVGEITIAVLGFGILNPPTTREQAVQKLIIENNGTIISEFPLLMHGAKQNFPIRNRIISGISNGTLVIEAVEKSGSLITAKSALEQNREVFAVPGSITSPTSKGTNLLLKNGAHMVTCAQDISDVFEMEFCTPARTQIKQKPIGSTPEETAILNLLSQAPIHIDEITRQTNLPAHQISAILSVLELKGFVQDTGGQYYTYA
ncbi:DNA-processing protein DprA [Patescibacteria group bacterium]|nr:DNA-processing protein DprA [Patescibacteria group bacterium]